MPTVFQRLGGTHLPPLARFSASELSPVGLRVIFETPRLPGIRSNLHMLGVVPPAKSGQFCHLLNIETQKHRVIGRIDTRVSCDRSVHAEVSDGLHMGSFESVVRPSTGPNLVCFSAAKFRRTSCTLCVPEMGAFSSFGVFGVMPSATTYVVLTDSTRTIPPAPPSYFACFLPLIALTVGWRESLIPHPGS